MLNVESLKANTNYVDMHSFYESIFSKGAKVRETNSEWENQLNIMNISLKQQQNENVSLLLHRVCEFLLRSVMFIMNMRAVFNFTS